MFLFVFLVVLLVPLGSFLKPVGEVLDMRMQQIYFIRAQKYLLSSGKSSTSLYSPTPSESPQDLSLSYSIVEIAPSHLSSSGTPKFKGLFSLLNLT